MSLVLHVRADDVSTTFTGEDLARAAPGVLGAATLVSTQISGPYAPLAIAVEADGGLRDRLAAVLPTPSLRGGKMMRGLILAASVLPLGLLLELDRELAARAQVAPSRVVVDLLLAAWTVWELTRRTPRLPKIAALGMLAVSARWALVATRHCGTTAPMSMFVYANAVLAFGAAAALATLVPSRGRVAQELLGKLGIARAEIVAARVSPPADGALVAAAIGCAAGLPALLFLLRTIRAGMIIEAAAFALYGALAPILVRRTFDRTAARSWRSPGAILLATAAGLTLAAAAVTSGHLFFDNTAELARCFHRLGTEAKLARAAESAELTQAIGHVRESAVLFVMTAAVFPFAEERIFRGLLQEVLERKYGRAYGIFAASVAFGVAHLGVYEVALYQTVLLGIGFGVAYAEGGLLAAFFVHATWNLIQLSS